MKLLALFLAAALVLVLLRFGALGVRAIARRIAARRAARAPWSLVEEPAGADLVLYAARPGRARIRLASLPLAAQDFTVRIYELRVEASDRVRALNDRDG